MRHNNRHIDRFLSNHVLWCLNGRSSNSRFAPVWPVRRLWNLISRLNHRLDKVIEYLVKLEQSLFSRLTIDPH